MSDARLNHALKWAKRRRTMRERVEQSTKAAMIYVIQSGEYTKVGIASMVPTRLADLQTGNPVELQMLHQWPSSRAEFEEYEIHKHLKPWHVRGEWFKLPCDVLEGLIGI